MATSGLLFIGIKGSAIALDRATGEVAWSTPLKGSDFVNVALLDGDLYATARGEVYCLDPATGRVRWTNPLTGYGWGLISIATAAGQAALMREKQKKDEAAAAG
jgi:outer membrane protein assembly factor BamB